MHGDYVERSGWQFFVLAVVVIFLAAFVVYSATWQAPFLFDDFSAISQDAYVTRFAFQLSDVAALFGSRGLTNVTFGMNYYFGGANVVSYHVVNFLIHVATATCVFVLVYSLLCRLFAVRWYRTEIVDVNNHHLVALVGALLFAVHPVQTMAVTYISQRLTSLAALFYVLALLGYVRARLRGWHWGWFAVALCATALAMLSKEISATIPFAILLLEGSFFSSSWRVFWRRLLWIVPFILSFAYVTASYVGLVPFRSFDPFDYHAVVEQVRSVDLGPVLVRTDAIVPAHYMLTELRVIVRYIALLVFPVHQNADYDLPLSTGFFAPPTTLFSLLFLLLLLGVAAWLFWRGYRMISFGIVFFFVALSIESSVITLPDVMFEYRLYLPFVGFVFIVVGVLRFLLDRFGHRELFGGFSVAVIIGFLVAGVLIGLGVAAYQRNAVWTNEVAFWRDVVAKSPAKRRGHKNLGVALAQAGDLDGAISEFHTVIAIEPDNASGYNNLGSILAKQGRYQDAVDALRRAQELDPTHAGAYHNLGSVYTLQNRWDLAADEYQHALELDPQFAVVHRDLGTAYVQLGRLKDALAEFERAFELDPRLPLTQEKLRDVRRLLYGI